MHDTIDGVLSRQLSAALGRQLEVGALPADTELSNLGLDSILAITTLIGLAEECGTDLELYAETLSTPVTLGDLRAVVAMFAETKNAA
jgi:hypothetical protein